MQYIYFFQEGAFSHSPYPILTWIHLIVNQVGQK